MKTWKVVHEVSANELEPLLQAESDAGWTVFQILNSAQFTRFCVVLWKQNE